MANLKNFINLGKDRKEKIIPQNNFFGPRTKKENKFLVFLLTEKLNRMKVSLDILLRLTLIFGMGPGLKFGLNAFGGTGAFAAFSAITLFKSKT